MVFAIFKISLGEMMAYLPVAGGHITMADRFVSKGFGFLLGWNYWYNWSVVLPAELRCVVYSLRALTLLTYISLKPQRRLDSHRILEQDDKPRSLDHDLHGGYHRHQHARRRYACSSGLMVTPVLTRGVIGAYGEAEFVFACVVVILKSNSID